MSLCYLRNKMHNMEITFSFRLKIQIILSWLNDGIFNINVIWNIVNFADNKTSVECFNILYLKFTRVFRTLAFMILIDI